MKAIHVKMARALRQGGGVYDLQDIVNRINRGDMQSFVNGDSWIVTTVHDYPRKRILNVDYVIGDKETLRQCFDEVYEFAKAHDCVLIRGIGRDGWVPDAIKDGWKTNARVYTKEV